MKMEWLDWLSIVTDNEFLVLTVSSFRMLLLDIYLDMWAIIQETVSRVFVYKIWSPQCNSILSD
jgi:hypothetical protein